MDKPCGMLLGAISQRFDTIVEFSAFENFYSFERRCRINVIRMIIFDEDIEELSIELLK